MKILVDAIPMTGLLTGIARYLRNMYSAMAAMNNVEISYLTGKKLVDDMPFLADSRKWQKATAAVWNLPDPVVFGLRSVHWLRYEKLLRGICRKNSFDIYHETAFVPAKLTAVPTIYSIYDLSLRRFRSTHPRERVWFFEYFLKNRMQFVSHILTISEFIRQEIIEEFSIPPEMVTSIPLAPDPVFGLKSAAEVKKVKEKYRLPESYLLFVSSLEPRKNIDLLINAMQAVSVDVPLVLVGWQGWGDKEWLEKIKSAGLKDRIYITGHISDNDLTAIYNGALALVYPSIYEGFGLPIVEAMACGCPVICSNAASMPEAAGDAAILIDPARSDELAAAIETIIHDQEYRNQLVKLGQKQAEKFSWYRTAGETLELFKMVVGK
ncbi:mannosyl-N-acetyl-alpha-D-glucosaminyl-diphospho-ditrans,octacis-undecaprenol 3-alpha-mannosyltransferase / alpha-1,3-rhamnosyltransferase [Desulfosarcina sp. BuS5]|uniref:glycosyltransferase family 4 protein n=1 Tax=Desulfosarcina sp. BuS5 TaxID=933262 RepID=UPI0005575D14|nr:glycosyltransferase family 1 protein [Desulfosarcina sp. BuS5]WDN90737.1 mannosyl-N-acetyl-alpha-D-glucosaminyl-diphospho-ditrans,octacis-undecaprenol 3-alpha-mannosyltransferase / alpha-1,3-rhamnosyltransferase [Desulfosarcina sp. BuS5]